MKLDYVDLCGFRSYRHQTRVRFAPGFTIIDGRNGAGKSTLFDAVEFALTGAIRKYRKATDKTETVANKQTVADYVWWAGEGDAPDERYVEVGFVDDDGTPFAIRRTEATGTPRHVQDDLARRLTYPDRAPDDPLRQLCKVALIRDEHIADFSLDLRETDRFALVREALGASDADDWSARGAALEKATKRAVAAADDALDSLRQDRDAVQRRIDEALQNRRPDSALQEAADRLRAFASVGPASDDEVASAAQTQIGQLGGRVEALRALQRRRAGADAARARLDELNAAAAAARTAHQRAQADVDALVPPSGPTASDASTLARDLARLVELGRAVGLRDDGCPLCGCPHDQESFRQGLAAARDAATALDAVAAERAAGERARADTEARLQRTRQALQVAEQEAASTRQVVEAFAADQAAFGLAPDADPDEADRLVADLEDQTARAAADLRTLETRQYETVRVRETRRAEAIAAQIEEAERVAGQARKAAATAKALHNAANRAALETLNERLQRVRPIMNDLYQRLDPHPVWKDINSIIRGQTKGFMRFEVGGQHNPQFIYSSGQRRATGLAFLLAVNLSLAWSRWETVLLDDPVQHVDDFRAVHLAEVVGQFVRQGRQVVCAVEDAALADLLTRRLPNVSHGAAQRVTLKLEADGSSTAESPRTIPQLPRHSITRPVRLNLAG